MQDHIDRPRVLLMGPRRSGKSSIQRVVFQNMSPHETLFLESTTELGIKFIANNPYVQFEVWDFPGDVNLQEGVVFEGQMLSPDLIFGSCSAIAYVIDAQDDPATEALSKLHDIVKIARSVNPQMHFEIFIHKVDGEVYLSEDHKLDLQRDIQEQVELELEDAVDTDLTLSFYLTSIYDLSIFEAFSKVVHKLIPQLPAMENLLNILIANCEVEKAFLYDVVSKIYIATDHNPVDIQSYELCSDMVEVVIDVSCIYGMKDRSVTNTNSSENLENGNINIDSSDIDAAGDSTVKDDFFDENEVVTDNNNNNATTIKSNTSKDNQLKGNREKNNEDKKEIENDESIQQNRGGLAFDWGSSSIIKLNNNMTLYLRQVANYLALVCIVRTANYEKQGLIDYNVQCFRKALAELFNKEDNVQEENAEKHMSHE